MFHQNLKFIPHYKQTIYDKKNLHLEIYVLLLDTICRSLLSYLVFHESFMGHVDMQTYFYVCSERMFTNTHWHSIEIYLFMKLELLAALNKRSSISWYVKVSQRCLISIRRKIETWFTALWCVFLCSSYYVYFNTPLPSHLL